MSNTMHRLPIIDYYTAKKFNCTNTPRPVDSDSGTDSTNINKIPVPVKNLSKIILIKKIVREDIVCQVNQLVPHYKYYS